VGEAEREAVVPPPNAQAEVLASGGPLPPQGSTPAVIDLMFDDSSSDKGKQKANVEMVDASDQLETSAVPDGDAVETSGRWPDFAELALVRAEEELPRWGQSTLEFRDAANPNAKHSVRSLRGVRRGAPQALGVRRSHAGVSRPSSSSIKMKCNTRSTSRGSASTPCGLCEWSWIPWYGKCRRPSR
jgi:hypothetical protein